MISNEANLFEACRAPRVQNVKVGDTIWTEERDDDEETRMVSWMVQQVYPFFVYATSGSRYKCFDCGMLVQLGLENGYVEEHSNENARLDRRFNDIRRGKNGANNTKNT